MNICVFAGRMASDPKTKEFNGKTVAQYDVACDAGYGERKTTLFVHCVHWDPKGALQYMMKGKPCIVEGYLREREYTDKNGNERKITELMVNKFEFQIQDQRVKEDKTLVRREEKAKAQNVSEDYQDDIPF